MNLLTKTIITILLTLAFTTLTFAKTTNFQASENFLNQTQNKTQIEKASADIPYFVTDPNFRWWQPPQPVPMIPSYDRNDTAWTNGYVIFYNPSISSQIPAKVAAFILAHEYGHIYWRTGDENASDAFAARVYAQTDPSVCQATVWWMTNFPNGGDATHPPSPLRAQNIARECGLY